MIKIINNHSELTEIMDIALIKSGALKTYRKTKAKHTAP